MKINKIPLREVGAFAEMFLKYLEGDSSLTPFYSFSPDIKGLGSALEQRTMSREDRLVLHEVLMEQYGPLKRKEANFNNILALQDEKTFTVTTGHQLNIFTGPLYVIFKIVSTINLAKKLKEAYPDYQFVPVCWMTSENHDLGEISRFNFLGKKYTWETEQKGPVGRFAPQSLNMVLEQIPEDVSLFEQAYLDQSTLAESVRFYMHKLFGDEGLVVMDADHARLKQLFAPTIEADLFEHKANEMVEKTNQQLIEAGYDGQAFSRKINFFYINGFRERIIEEEGVFKVNNTELVFTREELEQHLKEHPERFSPNVIMRPMYQETILPNIAYIGGPSEIVYWLQLKAAFEHYGVSFPVLLPRNFGMIINKGLIKKISKLNLPEGLLFKDAHAIKAWYLEQHSEHEHELDEEKVNLEKVFNAIKEKAKAIDQSLEGFIGAESAKALKGVDNIEKRLKKAHEQQNEIAMNQIDAIKEKLFPAGGLQERYDNFLNFSLNNPDFISTLLGTFDPLDYSFYQFWEG
jgi:bacillithiol biosynthesis cysteine-adding enzyme BshC